MKKFLFFIISMILCVSVHAQRRTVGGTVTDSDGVPIPGAAVIVDGTSRGTATDGQGKFTIDVTSGEKLRFDVLGYVGITVETGDRTDFRIVLDEDTQVLEETVVVGYGVQKKVNVTGAVASVDYAKEANSRPATTTAGLLAGAGAGIQISQNSGKPGEEDITILVRGAGTLNSNSPLVIVDGFETQMENVDPNDVSSISVLKDAASCAIYGNRGANGVILITTKSAGKGKFSIEYNGQAAVQEPSYLPALISNYADYMMLMNEAAENVGTSHIFNQTMIDVWREKEADPDGIAASGYPNYVAYPNTDWNEWFYRRNIYQKHSISASGAGDRTKWNIGLSYMDNPGIIENSAFRKFNFRANVASRVTDFLEIGAKVYGHRSDADVQDFSADYQAMLSRAVPCIYPYYDGKYGYKENDDQSGDIRNVLYFLNRTFGEKTNHYVNSAAFFNIFLPFGIKYNASFNYVYNNYSAWSANKVLNAWSFSKGEVAYRYDDLNRLWRSESSSNSDTWTFQTSLSWNGNFGRHEISAFAGFEASKSTAKSLSAAKDKAQNEILYQMGNYTTLSSIGGGKAESASASVFGRVNWAYDGKYLLEANIRYDGTSKFAARSRWGFFPSVSAGWRISQEPWMPGSGIDNLKLRASWGRLGNNSVGNYAYLALYSTGSSYPLGGALAGGLVPGLSNDTLHWETTSSTDIGVDFATFGNRLTIELDGYSKLTSDILAGMPIYLTAGTTGSITQNFASVRNRGIEITLGWKDTVGDFHYGISANFTRNWNKVTKFKGAYSAGWETDENGVRTYRSNIGDVSDLMTSGWDLSANRRLVEGHMMREFYTLNVYSGDGSYFFADGTPNPGGGPKDGMIRTEEDMDWVKAMIAAGNTFKPGETVSKEGIWYGDYIYSDVNGDGIYGDEYDRTFQGVSRTPQIYWGFDLNLGWKGIDFSARFTGQAGGAMYVNECGINSPRVVSFQTIGKDIAYDHYFYDPENPGDVRTNLTSDNPRLFLTGTDPAFQSSAVSNRWLYKTDFLRLQSLTVGYTFPKKWMSTAKISKLRIYFSGENLFTVTKYPGFDPSSTSTVSWFGFINRYPSMRQYTLGINFKF